ncbi:DUF5786 family protein [Haloarchaeobius salinus]|uniref:DUF5786 family protein n=1 Tax=Haloarchaeobius salinus TaxID=1198298 RepID=UPI00210C8A58|nr:DUF5786 family protein [Haloarchaeobius salinus]
MGFGSYDESEQQDQDNDIDEDDAVTVHEHDHEGEVSFDQGDMSNEDLVGQLQQMKDGDDE